MVVCEWLMFKFILVMFTFFDFGLQVMLLYAYDMYQALYPCVLIFNIQDRNMSANGPIVYKQNRTTVQQKNRRK